MTFLKSWSPFLLINVMLGLVLVVAALGKIDPFFITYPGIFIAMSAGFLGATFSMLLQNQRRVSEGSLEDLTAASGWHTLLVRGSVGLGAAVILYFFFESGLLEGSLWPNLKLLGFNEVTDAGGRPSGAGMRVPNKHWCLLVIWCFLAGFSETLVPTILQKTEEKNSSS